MIPAAAAGAVALGDVYALHDSLPSRYGSASTSAWLANRLVFSTVRRLDAPGAGVWGGPPERGEPGTLLDRPRLVSDEMVGALDATAGNDAALILGDFNDFVIADRVASTTVDFIPRLFSPTGRPTGQRGWLAHIRHGSAVINTAAFRMLTA